MKTQISAQNKRIAKNTAYLFVQKLIIILLALYTARILLKTLGIDDYGLYGLVGSIVVMFNSLRTMFSNSIQRFINVAKGEGDSQRIRSIYSTGVIIHLGMAVIFVSAVEIAAWFFLPDLNIVPERYNAAFWVLQCSVLSAVISLMTVPYDALLIANERFMAISVLSVTEYTLRLGVVFLLYITPGDRVVVYAILLVIVSIIVRIANAVYCHHSLGEEARFQRGVNKPLLKEMTGFAGWNFIGNLGYSLSNEGVNIVLNIFGGIVVNAARTITYQVSAALTQFVSYAVVSFQPRSITIYCSGDFDGFMTLQSIGAKVKVGIFSIIAAPLIAFTPAILNFWLGEIPPYTVAFIQTLLLYQAIRCLHSPVDTLFKAAGNLRNYQLCELFFMMLNLPLSWVALKAGAPYWVAFIIMAILETANLVSIMILANKMLHFPIRTFATNVVLRSVVIFGLLGSICYLAHTFELSQMPFPILLASSAGLALLMSLSVLLILFSNAERQRLFSLLPLERFKKQSHR